MSKYIDKCGAKVKLNRGDIKNHEEKNDLKDRDGYKEEEGKASKTRRIQGVWPQLYRPGTIVKGNKGDSFLYCFCL